MIRLSRHIEILLLDNDCVIVPGFGGFMAHHVDARKDESDGSFLPPMRSIGFNPKLTLNDSLLAQSYVEAYDISYPEAVMTIEDEVRELHQRLEADGSYEFNDIGVIKLNDEGNYEFTPCEAGILSPTLYGLGSFEMDTAVKPVMLENADEDESSEQKATDAESENRHSARMVAIWRNIAVACIAAIIFLLIPSPLVNNTQLAGTGIDTNLLDKVMPKNITTGQEKVEESVKETPVVAETPVSKEGYSIVVASHVTLKNANAYVEDLHNRGFKDAFVHRDSHVKVLVGHYSSQTEAYQALSKLNDKSEFAGAWVKKVEY